MHQSRDEAAAEARLLVQSHRAAMQALEAEQSHEMRTATAAFEGLKRSAAAQQQELQQDLQAWKTRFASR